MCAFAKLCLPKYVPPHHQGPWDEQCSLLHTLLLNVITRMESLRESRTDTVAHFALHEVPFDTSLYQQVARATTRLATKYVDVVMSSVCVRLVYVLHNATVFVHAFEQQTVSHCRRLWCDHKVTQ